MNLDDFDRCSRFESFKESWDHYGYGGDFEGMVLAEFSRIKGMTYLDHAGTTLFPESQIKGFFQDLCGSVYGNPHSHNPSSRLTHDTVEHVRYRILQHFNSSPEDYTVVFTAGCTAAIKLVAESFPWTPASSFCYLTDNHTSVVGIRGLTSPIGVASIPISPEEVEGRAGERTCPKVGNSQAPHLFCYPAQSNYSGKKYPLWHVKGIRSRELYPSCTREGQWFVLLDASNLVGCSPLDLQECPADFLPVSFYKMFGFPTGLGALIIRNECLDMLKKTYFGGGTAAAYLAGEDYYVPRFNIDGRFEDGTISFLDIIAVNHGFEALHRLTGGMERIQLHTFGLARHTYMMLSCLQHNNGQPVARLYCDTEYQDPSTQGPLLNFNLLDAHGDIVGYSKVQKLASLFNIQLRTGCFCNTGACQHYLGMSDQQVKANLQVTQWAVGPLGLLYDRLWMVVNINGVCLSQKQEPRLCLIQPSIHWACKELCLHATGMKPLSIPLEGNKQNPGVKVFQSKVCGDRVQSVDCGDEAADWISEFLGKPCRLIQQSPGFIRGMKRDHAKPVAGLSLVNEAQYLMINMASVKFLKEHINERQGPEAENLDIQQLIARFRANLVVMGAEPFEEDNWKHVVIGDLVFQVTDLCARCHMIGIDQQTATHMPEPLNSLSACRKGKVTFGVYLVRQHQLDLDHTSTLSVGCPVVPQSP
ncbi:molybdenum cofactor sulfurase-like isoform X5 [Paramormyrops kingsleyae]|uniref:molybdenum cofactor sulfurase-like isoform X5 n=1 Tax=Paramormyrops kingsleyae TaxID=1676925 RepID=UPI000CD5CD88|nr:molybdenum cofactor sulfurase isoform X6 [Paramormyrops kingsleyae]